MSQQPPSADDPTEGGNEAPLGGLLGRFARGAARAARRVQREAEDRRPDAERAAREAAERIRKAADAAKPEVERLARTAKAAADAALPHIERAAKDAIDYTREHQDQIKGAAGKAGRVAARGITPAPLRPAIDAFEQELTRPDDAEDADEPTPDSEDGAPSSDGSKTNPPKDPETP